MISYIKGTLAEKQPACAVVETANLGYEILIPLSTYDHLPAVNSPCKLLIYEHVREDTHLLFGFISEAERRMFLRLMDVSGIGPKLALSALSGMSVRDLTLAIVDGDVKRLSQVSGIGRKTAERMIVELRDKLDKADVLDSRAGATPAAPETVRSRDAVMALIALGHKEAVARKMVSDVTLATGAADLGVEEIVRRALGG